MPRLRGSFPHPVLGNGDDVVGTAFEITEVRTEANAEVAIVQVETILTDADLRRHLDAGTARVMFRVRCGPTMRLETLNPQELLVAGQTTRWRIDLSQDDFYGPTEFEVLVLATTEMDDFRYEAQHEDYGDAVFHVAAGDVIAVAGIFQFDIEKWYDPLNPPLSSFVRIVKSVTEDPHLGIDLGGEVIQVQVPPSAFEHLASLKGAFEPTLLGLLVGPAVLHGLQRLEDEPEDESAEGWARSLRALVERHGVEDRTPFEQAQKILNSPFVAGLAALREGVARLEEGDHD